MTTILIVEDYNNQRLLYEQEFRHEGYEAVTAVYGKEALEKVHEHLPDVIILDVNLPKWLVLRQWAGFYVKTKIFLLLLTLPIAIIRITLCHRWLMLILSNPQI